LEQRGPTLRKRPRFGAPAHQPRYTGAGDRRPRERTLAERGAAGPRPGGDARARGDREGDVGYRASAGGRDSGSTDGAIDERERRSVRSAARSGITNVVERRHEPPRQPMAEKTTNKITVLLVDDHALVRRGFRRLLEDDPDIAVVGEGSTGDEAITLTK